MLNLINSIGQRKVSKILFFISIFVALLCFFADKGAGSLGQLSTWFGVLLMSAPIGIISLAAHKTKEYRILCIVLQLTLVIINVIIYSLQIFDFLFILTLLEVIITIIFLIFVIKKKPEKIIMKKRRSNMTKSTNEATEKDAK